MGLLTPYTDFVPGEVIQSALVDGSFAQLVDALSGVSADKRILLKYNDVTDPPLAVNQTGTGLLQQWLQAGVEKARINNSGALTVAGATVSGGGDPLLLVNQTGSGVIQSWTVSSVEKVKINNDGSLAVNGALTAGTITGTRIKGVRQNISTGFTQATTSGTTNTSLKSFSIPANTFLTNNDYVVGTAFGVTTADSDNTGNFTISLAIGSATFSSNAVTVGNQNASPAAYQIDFFIARKDSTTFYCSVVIKWGTLYIIPGTTVQASGEGVRFQVLENQLTVSATTDALTVSHSGQVSDSGDSIICRGFIVESMQQ